MKVLATELPGVLILEPRVFQDDRGFLMETFHAKRYAEAGIDTKFVQDNWSRSVKDTLRGLHFQEPHGQGKLMQVSHGAIFDVAVDIRKGSPTFGRWLGVELSEQNHRQLWVPVGFAHGFGVLSESADVHYKCTDLYAPDAERGLLWNDPDLGIAWPIKNPLLSRKDAVHPRLKDISVLPSFKK
jgi:dTDP-4-dehydrorhamnose 3,5-epimerase